MATTANYVFKAAMALMDEYNSNGEYDTSDTREYKNRTIDILNTLRGELYPYSDSYAPDDAGRSIANLIKDFSKAIDLDDYICQTILPNGLAAHLLLTEDPATANFFQQRYDELKEKLVRGLPAVSEDVIDVYGSGSFEYNTFSRW